METGSEVKGEERGKGRGGREDSMRAGEQEERGGPILTAQDREENHCTVTIHSPPSTSCTDIYCIHAANPVYSCEVFNMPCNRWENNLQSLYL